MFRAAFFSILLVTGTMANALELSLNKSFTDNFVQLMQRYPWFQMGSGQGYTMYAAQIECASQDSTPVTERANECFVRPPWNFSRVPSDILAIRDQNFNRSLIKFLNDHDYAYMISVNGDDSISAVGGIVKCEVDTGANTPPRPPVCTVGPAFSN